MFNIQAFHTIYVCWYMYMEMWKLSLQIINKHVDKKYNEPQDVFEWNFPSFCTINV